MRRRAKLAVCADRLAVCADRMWGCHVRARIKGQGARETLALSFSVEVKLFRGATVMPASLLPRRVRR